jgi:serine/threonine-protein kinase RIM15
MSAWRGRDAASVGDAGEAEAEEGLWNLDEDEVDNEPPLLVMKPIPSSRDEEVMGTSIGLGGLSSAPSRANSLPGSKHASPRKGISVGGSPLAATQSLQVPIPMNLGPAFAASPRARARDLSPERRSPGSGAISTPADTPTGQAAEYLKFLAEHAKNVNIVMELSLEDQEVQYINNAINEVTGCVYSLTFRSMEVY